MPLKPLPNCQRSRGADNLSRRKDHRPLPSTRQGSHSIRRSHGYRGESVPWPFDRELPKGRPLVLRQVVNIPIGSRAVKGQTQLKPFFSARHKLLPRRNFRSDAARILTSGGGRLTHDFPNYIGAGFAHKGVEKNLLSSTRSAHSRPISHPETGSCLGVWREYATEEAASRSCRPRDPREQGVRPVAGAAQFQYGRRFFILPARWSSSRTDGGTATPSRRRRAFHTCTGVPVWR